MYYMKSTLVLKLKRGKEDLRTYIGLIFKS